MSSTAIVSIKGYEIDSSSNILNPSILQLFQESDLKVTILEKDKEEIVDAKVSFVSTLGNLLDRLRIIGFSKSLYEINFEINVKEEIDSLISIMENLDAVAKKKCKKTINLLKSSNIDTFNEAIKIIIDGDFRIYKNEYNGKNQICHYLLKNTFESAHPAIESFHDWIYTLGQIYPLDVEITYEFSEFIDYEEFEDSVYSAYQDTMESENYNPQIGEKIIILTEGTSDIKILNESMDILYPHLKDLYYFMDFHASNASGSTGVLVNTIKAFIGAGIKNKIIALFDNDTAAKEAVSSLKNVKIPTNIAILHLPHLKLAESYPTIGPTGNSNIDINGLAVSIELYLGKDVIKENGNYTPIQWTGYMPKVKSYQGEILKKGDIQTRFFQQIDDIKKGKLNKIDKDWSELKLIFEMIFEVFEENKI